MASDSEETSSAYASIHMMLCSGDDGAGGGSEPSYLKYTDVDLVYENGSYAKLLRHVSANSDLLELGPATGRMTEELRSRGCRVLAVERDVEAAALASAFCDTILVEDLDSFDPESALAPRTFDTILAADVLEHLRDPVSLLVRLRPYLRENGSVLASLPNVAHGSVRLALLEGRFPYANSGLLDLTHLRFFTEESAHQLFTDAGYCVNGIERVTRGLDETEVGFASSTLTPALKDLLDADLNALTYQFIIEATPGPGRSTARPKLGWPDPTGSREALINAQARHLETLRRLTNEQVASTDTLRRLTAEQSETIAALERRVSAMADELAVIYSSRSWRAAQAIRLIALARLSSLRMRLSQGSSPPR